MDKDIPGGSREPNCDENEELPTASSAPAQSGLLRFLVDLPPSSPRSPWLIAGC